MHIPFTPHRAYGDMFVGKSLEYDISMLMTKGHGRRLTTPLIAAATILMLTCAPAAGARSGGLSACMDDDGGGATHTTQRGGDGREARAVRPLRG